MTTEDETCDHTGHGLHARRHTAADLEPTAQRPADVVRRREAAAAVVQVKQVRLGQPILRLHRPASPRGTSL